MRLQFVQRHGLVNRRAVVKYVQTVLTEVHNLVSVGPLDEGIPDTPFLGNGPVKNMCSRGQFRCLQRNSGLDQSQSAPDSFAGDAAANRVELRGEVVELPACFSQVPLIEFFEQAHQGATKSGQVRSRSDICSTFAGQAIWNVG